MADFWLITLYVLVAATLLAAVGSWVRSLLMRDPSSFVHHRVPARKIAVGVTLLLALLLFLTSWGGVVDMLVSTIFLMVLVAGVASVIAATGVLRNSA